MSCFKRLFWLTVIFLISTVLPVFCAQDETSVGESDIQAVSQAQESNPDEDLPVYSEHDISQSVVEDEDMVNADNEELQDSENKEEKDKDDNDEELISISFATGKEISEVLRALAAEAGINIVMSPEVSGPIAGIELNDVKWEDALNVIVSTYGFGYEKQGNIVTVAPLEKITQMKKQKVELNQVQETTTKVFELKFIDAGDALKVIETFLSPRGTAEVLQVTGQAGWNFVTAGNTKQMEKSEREGDERKSLSRKLIVTDIKPVIEKVAAVIESLDVKPKQVMIEANLVEVDWKKLKDLGSYFSSASPMSKVNGEAASLLNVFLGDAAGATPVYYSSPSNVAFGSNVGGGFTFTKLKGNTFTLSLSALEELADANVISAPKIMTLDNQEASILVGRKYPITSSSSQQNSTTTTTTTTLEYYQDIGIQLNVVPQVNKDDYIKMIIHPAVVEWGGKVGDVSESTTSFSSDGDISVSSGTYPVLDVREAETQLIMKSGETIVIGGLMKDQDKSSVFKVPGLSALPVLGSLFKHASRYVAKMDLFIFVTATIVDSSEENLKAQAIYKDTQNKIRHY